jgi:hypothetical protein
VRGGPRRPGRLIWTQAGYDGNGEGVLVRSLTHRRAAWLVALPVATASWLNAHCLAYVLVPPAGGEHMHHHVEGGHTYFWSTPVLIAALVTILAAGLVLCVGAGLRGGAAGLAPPALLFALLPPLGFVVQEHVAELLRAGSLPTDLIAEPTFLTGLALQLPFAVAALLLCRCLYALGYGLGRFLARRLAVTIQVPALAPSVHRRPTSVTLIPPSVLALGHGSRAPPAPARP